MTLESRFEWKHFISIFFSPSLLLVFHPTKRVIRCLEQERAEELQKKERSIWMLMLLINNLAAKWLTRLRKVYSSCLRFWILSISCFLSSPCLLLCAPYILWCDVFVCHTLLPFLRLFFYLTFLKQRGKLNFKIFTEHNWLLATTAGADCTLKCFNVRPSSVQKTREIINFLRNPEDDQHYLLVNLLNNFRSLANFFLLHEFFIQIHNSFEFIALISFFSRVFPHRLHPRIKVKVFVFLLLITINEVMIAINFISRVDWWWERPASWSWKIEAIYWNHCDRVWENKNVFQARLTFPLFHRTSKFYSVQFLSLFITLSSIFSLFHLKTENWMELVKSLEKYLKITLRHWMDRETWKLKLSTRLKKRKTRKKVSILHHKKNSSTSLLKF